MHTDLPALAPLDLFDQLWLTLFLVVPMVLIARTVVSGSCYSPILIIVVFGLGLGYVLQASGAAPAGLPGYALLAQLSGTTLIVLTAAFFAGGQQLRRVFGHVELPADDTMQPCTEAVLLGTNRTQLMFVLRTFFLLLGLDATRRMLLGDHSGRLTTYAPLLAFVGLVLAFILIDHKATLRDKRDYLRKGLVEVLALLGVVWLAFGMARAVADWLALPAIFFAMLLACALGWIGWRWQFGPTLRALLFAGIPVVLAANFIIGGSRIEDALAIDGVDAVLAYGFFGQILWMFGGIGLLMWLGQTAAVRNLAPGMAGALSHAGLTGACTADDMGPVAAQRAPIMINVPFLGHVFVFSILTVSWERQVFWWGPALLVFVLGLGLTGWALRTLRRSGGQDGAEVRGLMQFSLGWQLTAMFGGLLLLAWVAMPLDASALAKASSLSHFGLFAATQGGMFGPEAAGLIAVIFSMPFLVHPFVFYLFGRAMTQGGDMPRVPVYALAACGAIGVSGALWLL